MAGRVATTRMPTWTRRSAGPRRRRRRAARRRGRRGRAARAAAARGCTTARWARARRKRNWDWCWWWDWGRRHHHHHHHHHHPPVFSSNRAFFPLLDPDLPTHPNNDDNHTRTPLPPRRPTTRTRSSCSGCRRSCRTGTRARPCRSAACPSRCRPSRWCGSGRRRRGGTTSTRSAAA